MATMTEFQHIPVLAEELIAAMEVRDHTSYLDCTVGGGGHSKLLCELAASQTQQIQLIAIDRDLDAIVAAKAKLKDYPVAFWQGNFSEFIPEPEQKFDGILADLGVSSAQFDIADRGFSFRETAPLDMRMDRSQDLTAADIVNDWEEQKLVQLFFDWGEERFSRRIVRQIISQRPIITTTQLASAIAQSVPSSYRYGRIHPATRVFQALRIAVNQELKALENLLEKAPTWLKPGGKIAIISFHSLEDRLVKHSFRQNSTLQVFTKKPIVASDVEIAANARSRSAKMRVAQKHFAHQSDRESDRESDFQSDY
jgi:16S rRNA (cytosine1402-N4)-methyltransferase